MIRVACVLCMMAAAYGQRFEVAAIKPSNADPSSSGMYTGHGRIHATNVTLKRCIQGAYGVGPNQVVGGPDWLESDRFEITAKAEEPVGDSGLMVMLQTLMAERFKLTLHRESRPIQAYVLEAGKNGPKMDKGQGGDSSTNNGRGDIVAKNASMDHLAEVLARQMDLPVVNHTGLEGVFNLRLQWTPDSARRGDSDQPSIFTAIQEQLGLRLRAEKTPVEVIVIDHAERPTEN
jgi:uncharacterized protein (TIGR03435 family)